MDDLHLSDTLQRYFSDVFLCCDEENAGKASLNKTLEVIKSGNVPDDIVAQVKYSTPQKKSKNNNIFELIRFVRPFYNSPNISTDLRSLLVPAHKLPKP